MLIDPAQRSTTSASWLVKICDRALPGLLGMKLRELLPQRYDVMDVLWRVHEQHHVGGRGGMRSDGREASRRSPGGSRRGLTLARSGGGGSSARGGGVAADPLRVLASHEMKPAPCAYEQGEIA